MNHINFEISQKIKQSNLRMIKKIQRVMTSSLAFIIPRQAIMVNLVIKDDDRIIDIGCEGKSFLGIIAKSVGLQKDYLWI